MLTAIIDPNECIGCGICLEKCPFDAILGSPGTMHIVMVEECIGCKLCINPCPVDCIALSTLPDELSANKHQMIAHAKKRRIAKIERISKEKTLSLMCKEVIQQDLRDLLNNS